MSIKTIILWLVCHARALSLTQNVNFSILPLQKTKRPVYETDFPET